MKPLIQLAIFFGIGLFAVVGTCEDGESHEYVSCPEGFVAINDGCYFVSTKQLNWYQAFRDCVSRGASLATIETSTENEAIKEYLRGLVLSRTYWIGGTDDSQEGYFVWMSSLKAVTFTDWCSGDPNNYGIENCIYYYHDCDYRWQDRSCDFGYSHYLCEL